MRGTPDSFTTHPAYDGEIRSGQAAGDVNGEPVVIMLERANGSDGANHTFNFQ